MPLQIKVKSEPVSPPRDLSGGPQQPSAHQQHPSSMIGQSSGAISITAINADHVIASSRSGNSHTRTTNLSVLNHHHQTMKDSNQHVGDTSSNSQTDTVISNVFNYTLLLQNTMTEDESVVTKKKVLWHNVPTQFLGEENLPLAMFNNFRAKKLILSKPENELKSLYKEQIVKWGDTVSEQLHDNLAFNKIKSIKKIKLVTAKLYCDWILKTRTFLWEIDYETTEDIGYCQVPGYVHENFQKDLNSLRTIVDDMANAQSRIYLYEAVCRLMAGASPGQTQHLLDRSLRCRYSRGSIK